jgi:hypothetical protein
MKKLIPILIAVLAMIAVPTKAATCPTGVSLSGGGYTNANGTGNGFSCTIGNLTFSNFSFTSSAAGSASAMTPAGVTVTPLPNSSFPGVPDGFLFTEALSANNTLNTGVTTNSDMTIFYSVTSNGATLTDLELGFNGSVSGTGITEVTENFCLNTTAGVFGCAYASSGQIQVINPPGIFNTSVTFAPVTMLSVEKDVQLNAGTNGGVSLSSIDNMYSQTVPESASLTLLGLGLLGLALAKRSKLGQLSL